MRKREPVLMLEVVVEAAEAKRRDRVAVLEGIGCLAGSYLTWCCPTRKGGFKNEKK